jgi:hypothetical protein
MKRLAGYDISIEEKIFNFDNWTLISKVDNSFLEADYNPKTIVS